ncbi:short-chain dehydrogenase [Mycolicibacterium peregrinum]|uniref:mycofactocin-coupled SDR family oxidoreductase n=1 Tax=Mycolicibacterium peregrinum TaxID=43304 RepID=UPI0007EC0EB7|nr:mycofactocin-coupled SDR family oxidoreductase [Mycolicibacterium peregrinum]OBF37418.1 short-chain dehydrogenase [Mycolicibacterium peregrinum]
MGRLSGKVAVISGAARGQGRAHAITMAREGAAVVAFDICEPLTSPMHPASTWKDLEETRALVEELGGQCLISKTDARDLAGLKQLAADAVDRFGRVDVLIVNHGIWAIAPNSWSVDEEDWQESVDVLLTGAWKVTKAFIPAILDGGRGGSIILTSSAMGQKPQPGSVAYTVAKHGVLGLMRTLSWELGAESVRVNALMPGTIATPMTQEGGTVEQSVEYFPRFFTTDRSLLPASWLSPQAIADAALFLASDDSAFISGVAIPVDAGWSNF